MSPVLSKWFTFGQIVTVLGVGITALTFVFALGVWKSGVTNEQMQLRLEIETELASVNAALVDLRGWLRRRTNAALEAEGQLDTIAPLASRVVEMQKELIRRRDSDAQTIAALRDLRQAVAVQGVHMERLASASNHASDLLDQFFGAHLPNPATAPGFGPAGP